MASNKKIKNTISYKSAVQFAESFERGLFELFRALGADREHYLSVNLTEQTESLFLYESEYHLIAMPEREEKGILSIGSLPEKPLIIMVTAEDPKWLDLFGKVLMGRLFRELSPVESEKLYRKVLTELTEGETDPNRENGADPEVKKKTGPGEVRLGTYDCRICREEKGENYIEFCANDSNEAVRSRVKGKLTEFHEEDFDFVQILGTGIEQTFLDRIPNVTLRGNRKSGDCLYSVNDAVRVITKGGMVTGVRIENLANFQAVTIHFAEDEATAVEKMKHYLTHLERIPGGVGYRRYSYRGDVTFKDHTYVMTVDIFAGTVSGITLMKKA